MKVGLLGAGRIGSKHAEVLAAHPAVASLLIADEQPDRAQSLARALGPKATAASVSEVFSTVAALVVAAPTPAHGDLLLRAAAAGLPTFCEKPLADTLARTVQVVERLAESQVPIQVGFQRRFDAGYAAARGDLRAGRLGELRRVHLLTCDASPPAPEFIATSGGIFRDCSIHDFDAVRWVTGREVEAVFAAGVNRGDPWFGTCGDVDEAAAVLTLDDNTLATVQASRYNGGGYDVRMELAGTTGTLVVGMDDRMPLRSAEPGQTFPAGPAHQSFWERFRAAYEAEIRAFVDVARGAIDSPCTPQDALAALYVAEAAELSRRESRPVAIAEVRGTR